tara:strand:- start:269 stop:607 length:339 start_codon:yes stop_codon:yes gene_type:complete
MTLNKLCLNILFPIIITILCTLFLVAVLSANENVIKREATKSFLCAEHGYLVNDLTQQWKQERIWYGLTHTNEIIELFVNQKNGRFTIITTGTDKISCGLIGGNGSSTLTQD